MTMSVHASLHAVFRVGKPQYDLLRFDFQVGFWRDRRLPDRRSRRRRLLLLSLLRESAPGEQPDGAERSAWDVQLSLRRCGRRQPELRQLLPLQHRSIRYLLHSGGLTSPSSHDRGEAGRLSSWSITGAFPSSIYLIVPTCRSRQAVRSSILSNLFPFTNKYKIGLHMWHWPVLLFFRNIFHFTSLLIQFYLLKVFGWTTFFKKSNSNYYNFLYLILMGLNHKSHK